LTTYGYPRQMQTHNLAATNVILEQQYSPWVEACILLQSTLIVGQEHWRGTLCTRSDPCQLMAIQDRCKRTTWQPQM
jgi:hypothetical protein